MNPDPSKPDSVVRVEEITVPFYQAFLFWLKLGLISFGGPAGQIAIMHQELVEQRRWISERRFLHALNYCMLLPGPEAQQLAIYIGWLLHRTWGGIVAGVLFVLPSLFILIALAWVYIAYGDVPLVAGIFYGIKPAVTAIVFQAAWRIGGRTLKNPWLWAIAAAAFIGIFVFRLPFPLIVLCAALAGYLGGRYAPQYFQPGGGHAATEKSYGAAVIDDDTPTPDHARFAWSRLAPLLIMVVAFVAFIGGYVLEVFGPDQVFMAGAVAATLVTWFTFLPSFLFILGGGPLVESTHGQLGFTAPLTGITAAVVGVILNLALFFGYHVLWPEGFDAALDWPSAVIALGAAVLLFGLKLSVMKTLGFCALAGLVAHLLF